VRFPSVNADSDFEARREIQALPGKKLLCLGPEIPSNMGVAPSTFALKWSIHGLSPQGYAQLSNYVCLLSSPEMRPESILAIVSNGFEQVNRRAGDRS